MARKLGPLMLAIATQLLIPVADSTLPLASTVNEPNPVNGDMFGYSSALDLSASYAIFGSHFRNSRVGEAYFAARSGDSWLVNSGSNLTGWPAPGGYAPSEFGAAIAVTGQTPMTVYVGAPGTGFSTGRVYVFSSASGTGNDFQPLAVLASPASSSLEKFGAALAVSRDGTQVIVGAPSRNSGGSGSSSLTAAGAVFSCSYAGTYSCTGPIYAPDPMQTAYFGNAVAFASINSPLSGQMAVMAVGAYGFNNTGITGTGGAYVFTKSGTSSTWSAGQHLVPNVGGCASNPINIKSNGNYGTSVAIDGTQGTIVVGAPVGGNVQGGAFVFTMSSGSVGTTWSCFQVLKVSDGTLGDSAGTAVAISYDGSHILVTVPGRWAAYLFNRSDSTQQYVQVQKIVSPDSGVFNVDFGFSAALGKSATSGYVAAVGAPGSGQGISNMPGKSYVFYSPSGTAPTQSATASASATPSGTASASATASATATVTSSASSSTTASSTSSASSSATATASSSGTASSTASASAVATSTAGSSASNTPSNSPSNSLTSTSTLTATSTATATATSTATGTATMTSTSTSTATGTSTSTMSIGASASTTLTASLSASPSISSNSTGPDNNGNGPSANGLSPSGMAGLGIGVTAAVIGVGLGLAFTFNARWRLSGARFLRGTATSSSGKQLRHAHGSVKLNRRTSFREGSIAVTLPGLPSAGPAATSQSGMRLSSRSLTSPFRAPLSSSPPIINPASFTSVGAAQASLSHRSRTSPARSSFQPTPMSAGDSVSGADASIATSNPSASVNVDTLRSLNQVRGQSLTVGGSGSTGASV